MGTKTTFNEWRWPAVVVSVHLEELQVSAMMGGSVALQTPPQRQRQGQGLEGRYSVHCLQQTVVYC